MSAADDLELLAERTGVMLSAFLSPGPEAAAAMLALRPRPEDFARVFAPAVAGGMAQAYAPLWRKPPLIQGKSHQTQVRVFVRRAVDLALESDAAQTFPAGYRAIASYLQPDPVWIRWKFTAPGTRLGTAYEGIVALDDRWAWFPRPHIILPMLLEHSS